MTTFLVLFFLLQFFIKNRKPDTNVRFGKEGAMGIKFVGGEVIFSGG
jgi:hypothetical protein